MKLSRFAPLSLMRLSGREPDSRRIYNAMIEGFGGLNSNEYNLQPGSRLEAFCHATALAIARARQACRRAGMQHLPWAALEGLPLLEQEFGLVPGPLDTLAQRRAAVAQRALLPVMATRTAVIAGLVALLGSDFVAYHTQPAASSNVWPTNLGDAPMALKRPDVLRKIIQLSAPVDFVGVPKTVQVTIPVLIVGGTADTTSAPVAGDVFVFDVGRTGQMDRVTLSAVSPLFTFGVPYPTAYSITATFTRPHETGVMGFTHPIPYWMSDKRNVTVVVSASAASDPVKRGKVNAYMKRTVRGTTTWDIVSGTVGGTTQFQIGQPSISTTTISSFVP